VAKSVDFLMEIRAEGGVAGACEILVRKKFFMQCVKWNIIFMYNMEICGIIRF